MVWLILSVLTAFFASVTDVFSKFSLNKTDSYIVAWAIRIFSVPFLLLLIPFTNWQMPQPDFWFALFSAGLLNVFTTLLYMRAIQSSDLSVTIPMIAFTPLFMLITSPLILGEMPDIYGFAGVILIVAGAYIINIQKQQTGFFSPFKALWIKKGPRLMLIVAFLYSITSNFDKMGVINSSPFIWVISSNVFIAVMLTAVMIFVNVRKLKFADPGSISPAGKQIKNNYRLLIATGMFSAMMLVVQMSAMELTLAAYVIAIKRTSVIGGIIFGYYYFKEPDILQRMGGALLMIAGVALITLS